MNFFRLRLLFSVLTILAMGSLSNAKELGQVTSETTAAKRAQSLNKAINKSKDPDKAGTKRTEDSVGVGYDTDRARLVSLVEDIEKSVQTTTTNAAVNIQMNGFDQIKQGASKYSFSHGICLTSDKAAEYVCNEESSPQMINTINKMTLLASTGGIAVKDACGTAAKVLNAVKAGLSLYTATCGAARATCEKSCGSSKKGIDQVNNGAAKFGISCSPVPGLVSADAARAVAACQALIAKVQTNMTEIRNIASTESNKEDPKAIAGKDSICTYDYGELIVSAGVGILSTIQMYKEANKCDQDATGTSVVSTDLDVKCKLAEHKESVECKCHLNPLMTGCTSAQKTTVTSDGFGSSTGTIGSSGTTRDIDTGSLLDGERTPALANKSSDDSSLPGAPTGGGGSGIGGGGDGGGGSAGDGGYGDPGAGANADVLSGYDGGGGGGWGGGGSGSAAANSKYRSYLPGGANDPNKGMSGQTWTKEVTAEAGKSNWEKVRDRYRDNKNTLLNN